MKDITEFRSGYKPLTGAVIGAGCGLSSISFYTHGAFVSPISEDTLWSRGDVQLGVTIMILMAVISAPTVGWLVDRFSARRVALLSIPLYGITLASLSLATDAIWTYYAAWTCMSVLAAGTLPITWTRVVTAWFDDYRGIALGITLAGTGVAATLAPSYVVWLVSELGWRSAYVVLAITVTAIGLPAVYLLFRDPPDANETRLDRSQELRVQNTHGVPLSTALGQYRFWIMAIGLLLVAAGISGLITNLVPLLIDKGFTPATAGRYAGLIGISVISGRLLAGFLIDRVWAPLVAAVFLSAPCAAALLLSADTVTSSWIALSAIVIGLSAGAELDLMAFLASRYFGLRHYGAIYGALYVFFSIGAGLAPFAFGRVFDNFGHYAPVLNVVAVMSVVGGAIMLLLGPYPKAADFET